MQQAVTAQTKEVMNRTEVANYLRIGKSTLDKLDIPKIQIRRRVLFQKKAVDQWLSRQSKEVET